MKQWTSCQYDDAMHLVSATVVEGGINPRQQALRRSQEYETEHKGCAALEIAGGLENCPIDVIAQDVVKNHYSRGK